MIGKMRPIGEIKEKIKEKYQQEMRIAHRSDDAVFTLVHKEKATVYFDCFAMLSEGPYSQIKEEIAK